MSMLAEVKRQDSSRFYIGLTPLTEDFLRDPSVAAWIFLSGMTVPPLQATASHRAGGLEQEAEAWEPWLRESMKWKIGKSTQESVKIVSKH